VAGSLSVGAVILVALPSNQPRGREQEGRRPAIIVGLPIGETRYPMAVVLPMTTATGSWADRNPDLYYRLNAGMAGLTRDSVVLTDQIRAIDITRISGYLGSLTATQYEPIAIALKQLFQWT
jgi:mRNA interferase MazF